MSDKSKASAPANTLPNAGSIANLFRPNRAAPNIGNVLVLSSLSGLAPVDSHSIARLTTALENSSNSSVDLSQARLALRILSSVGDGLAPFAGLKGVAGIGLEILNVVDKAQNNREAMRAVALRVYEMIRTINEGTRDGGDDGIRVLITQFERDLRKVLDTVKDVASQKAHRQVMRAELVKDQLADCDNLLNQYTDRFQVALGINQQQILVRQEVNLSRQQESIEKIVNMLEKHTMSTPVNNLLISAIAPAPPVHFVGRDDLVHEGINHIADHLLTSAAHIAILGHGGIGKTSLSLAILQHEKSKAAFCDHCYFVPCEAFKSGLDLVQAIIHILGGSMLGKENDGLVVLQQQLANAGKILLVIDNFETLWLESTSIAQVKLAMETIMSIESVSILITMRGFEPPSGFKWTLILPPGGLGPLSLNAAKDMYIQSQHIVPDDTEWNRDLELLLTETDCIPLAISLLSALGNSDPRVYTPGKLLQRWTKTKTKLLKIPGVQKNKMTSIAISIDVSLQSTAIIENPDTLKLLQIIAFLPEGLPHWGDLIEKIIQDSCIEDPYDAVEILCCTSLTYKKENKSLTMLSPTRHYINAQALVDAKQFEEYLKHIFDFINLCVTNNSEDLILFGMPNITQIFERFLILYPSTKTAESALQCSEYLFGKNEYMTNLIEIVIKTVSKLPDSLKLLVRCVVHHQDILMALNLWSNAEQKGQDAYEIYQQLDNELGMAECLQNIGHNMKMQSKNAEAIEKHLTAHNIYNKLGKKKQVASSLKAIGANLRSQHEYAKAVEKLTEALNIYTALKDKNGMANCLKGIGNSLRSQKKYSEALEMHTKAYNYYCQKQNKEGMAGALNCLGDDLRMLEKYDEAGQKHADAYIIFTELKNELGLAASLDSYGDALRLQNKYLEAAEKHDEAYRIFVKYQYWHGIGNCLNSIGDNLKMQKKYVEATEKYKSAHDIFKSVQNHTKMSKCLDNITNVLGLVQASKLDVTKPEE